jgi:hypothetical protein
MNKSNVNKNEDYYYIKLLLYNEKVKN